MKYLQDRGLAQTEGRKVWAFMGDGEMDEPESMGAIGMAAREKLDNLVFVVNCNLQRLDGPVRGNGKIIQELESDFRGSGWNVIKIVWGRHWDPLFARDKKGILMRRMMEVVDGEYQTIKSKNGAYVREHFFNTPELKELVADYTDDDIWKLNRGGHDPFKVYNGYHAAMNHKGQPTVILAKTIKGYGMGESGEAQNITHQQKKMSEDVDAQLPRPLRHSRARRQARGSALRHVSRRLARARVHARPPDGPRRLSARAPRKSRRARHAGARHLRALPQEHRGPRDLDHDGVRADPAAPAARQESRQAHRADRPRRIAHVRHGGPLSPAWHLEPAGAALHSAGLRAADVLQGVEERPDPAGRHQRGRRDVRLDRRGHELLDARRADDPVLYLLLDVRFPTGG